MSEWANVCMEACGCVCVSVFALFHAASWLEFGAPKILISRRTLGCQLQALGRSVGRSVVCAVTALRQHLSQQLPIAGAILQSCGQKPTAP